MHHVFGPAPGGQHYDWYLRELANTLAYLEAIHPRHDDVKEDQGWLAILDEL
jgi:hypothetical protein